ncbi:MAG: sortase [bacterium]
MSSTKDSLPVKVGLVLLIISALILSRLFGDPVNQEVNYAVRSLTKSPLPLTISSTDFSLVIPRLGASAPVVSNVDPSNSRLYQQALAKGVAHAKGTKFPGEGGNIFIFAHSSADLLLAERYNSVFYLLHHLQSGDVIKVWYQNHEYDYSVTEKLFVPSTDTKYMTTTLNTETLTLMTCWPPGTTLKRLIVIAKPL